MLAEGGAITNVQGSVDVMGLVGRFIGGGNGGNTPATKPPAPKPLGK